MTAKSRFMAALIVLLARFATAAAARTRPRHQTGIAKGHRVMHKFTIGQSVDLITTVLRPSAAGAYEIRHLVPAPDGSPENPRYRIKNIAEKHERVASESELTAVARVRVRYSPDTDAAEGRSHHGFELPERQPQLRFDAACRPVLGI